VHERIRQPIAALAVVWVLLAALGAGAAALVADDGATPEMAREKDEIVSPDPG
jgi:tryptophan-rich sensory protein